MPLIYLLLFVLAIFGLGYYLNSRFLTKHFQLDAHKKTPACEVNDGVDYVPTSKWFLLSQHFSAIAAAGPIVGPILAAVWFGWLPVMLWIVGGSIFFGAFHDFSSLVSSVRHKSVSIVEMVKEFFGPRGHLLFMLFVWFSLIYVITAFTDLTSSSFVDPELGGAVASSSVSYLLLGLAMGVCLNRFKMPLNVATLIFIPLVCVSIWFGRDIPLIIPAMGGFTSQQIWNFVLLAYCLFASVIPVSVLLQPRGYLGGFFLYGTLAAGLLGLLIGGEKIQYPAFTGWTNTAGLPLFPALFVTVACGACSGFHGIVSSGTTSKQIENERDCSAVGYGGMLLEGIVAILALSTVMILGKDSVLTSASPDRIYAEGLSQFVGHLGIPVHFSRAFVLLAFTTFIYDTLDVATRLARYILQELMGWRNEWGRWLATILTLVIPCLCVTIKMTNASGQVIPAWKVFWSVFGTSNQLLAAMTLLALAIWMAKIKKAWWLAAIPMVFLTVMTVWSFTRMIWVAASSGKGFDLPAWIASLLLVLAGFLFFESIRFVFRKPSAVSSK